MNIQIFSRKKCFDSKKAERWFKERRIKIQLIDIMQKGLSPRELDSVVRACGMNEILNENSEDYALFKYLAGNDAKYEKLLENLKLLFEAQKSSNCHYRNLAFSLVLKIPRAEILKQQDLLDHYRESPNLQVGLLAKMLVDFN